MILEANMKEGTVREDGLVYWRYDKMKGRHIWLSPQKYEEYCEKRKSYRKMCVEAYHKRQQELPDDEKNYFGKYDWKKNKYFIGISTSGKEVWYYKARFENLVARRQEYRKKYLDKARLLPKNKLRIGDKNPDNPEEYVINFIGNMPRFGDIQKLELANLNRKICQKKMSAKYRKERKEKLSKLFHKRRRGDINSEGNVFWEYDRRANEVWYTPDVFAIRQSAVLAKKKLRRLKKNQNTL